MERVMVQTWMFEDFAEEWLFELELVLVSSLVLVEVVDVEETKYGSYQKVQKVHMFGRKKMARRDDRVTQLDSELRAMLAQRVYSRDFDKKEAEIRALKGEIARIDSERVQPTMFTSSAPLPVIKPTCHPFLPSFSSRTYEPSKLFDSSTENSPSQLDSSSIESSDLSNLDTSNSNLADISKLLMAKPTEQSGATDPGPRTEPVDTDEENQETSETGESSQSMPPQPKVSKPSNGPWFTFDDIPPTKWRERLQELSDWIDLQLLAPDATTHSVLREFSTRFTGSLRDWFDSLGQYRQLKFIQISTVSQALAVLHDQFIAEPSVTFEAARRDYLNMKCFSLNTKDLHYHYKRMSLLYYKLSGFNDPTLRHIFLASLPEELQPEIQRQLAAHRLNIDTLSLGKLFQIALGCLDKLCEQKKLFQELIKDKEPFRYACKKPYLGIKCKDPKKCDCSPKKKSHFKKFRFPFPSRKWCTKLFRFFRKRQSHSKRFPERKKSRCFICKKKCHFAKDCPVKPHKAIKLIQHLDSTTEFSPTTDQVEHLFSEQEEPNDDTIFPLPVESSDSDSSDFEPIYTVQPSSILIHDRSIPIPSVKIQIIPSKYHKPITAIGFIDIGAQRNASDESWGAILLEECNGHFIAYASGQFIDAQKHYHTVYKEILAVKNVPHITYLEQDFQIKTPLKNFLMELNYIPPDQPEILHTSLGPKHEMFIIPTSSLHSQPPKRRLIIKEEKSDYIDFLFQDSQDPYEDFTPVPSPSPYDFPNFPGSSSSQYPPFSSQPEHFP
ncbi:hypothetical protein KPL70_001121 [Citrus sinensis]|nr:hypothetical protein KPL70_001121 [Citrus sinensis]